ncbi:MAG: ABC transporter permease [Deltaproteobacteria bacterium]|nr:ABC transporter permease [Deltaproteobacteria bacterium]MBW2311892.1 ABC transporter permease [Deltaproteobacteria bacterium]RLB28583.1 MAG: ABC transporter permease [Deltaproteobacteria bacterium]
MSWLRIRELVRKEFIQLFRDKKNRPLLIIAPFVQLLVFGYVLSTDVRDVRVGIVDQSRTRESRLLMDALNANRTFRITQYTNHPKELDEVLLRRKVDLALKIGPDFSERIRKGNSAPVQILADGSMSNMASLRIAYTSLVLEGFNQRMIEERFKQRLDYGKIDARIRTWYNPNLDSRNFFVPGIVAILIMILSLLLTSMAIIREKEAGTIEQLIVTPLRPIELILGKTIPYIIITQTLMIIVITFAIVWFSLPLKGNFFLLIAAACLFLLSTLGIGLFISTISATQQQAMMTTFFFILPFFMFSGFVFPIASMPTVIQWLTYLNPLRYFLVIIRGVFLKGVGMEILWPQFIAMMVLGLIVFISAVKRFRKRLD